MFSRYFIAAFAASVSTVASAAVVDWSNPASVVDTALSHSPRVIAAEASSRAAAADVRGSGALPNPMLMGGVQDKQVNLADDPMMTMYMVGASQRFTRREKRVAETRVAEARASAAALDVRSLRAEIERDVLLGYYEVAALDGQLKLVRKTREVLVSVVDAARARYESGAVLQADVLRAQLQVSGIDRRIIELRGRRAAAAARLRVSTEAEGEVPTLDFPEESAKRSLTPRSLEDHPALQALDRQRDAAEQIVAAARLASKPDLEIEASYGVRRSEADMFSVLARVELPLRKKPIAAGVESAVAQRERLDAERETLLRELQRAVALDVAAHDEATQQLKLIDTELLPQTQATRDAILAAYEGGQSPLESVLVAEAALDLQSERYDLMRRHLAAIVDAEAIQRGARSGAAISGDAMSSAVTTSLPSQSSMNGMK